MPPVLTDQDLEQSIGATYDWVCRGCYRTIAGPNRDRIKQLARAHADQCVVEWWAGIHEDELIVETTPYPYAITNLLQEDQ